MRHAIFGLILALCGCPVQVDQVNIDHPSADVDVNANANATANVNANQAAPDAGTADETDSKQALARVAQKSPESSSDFDGDGIPNELDTCPTDGDADHDGVCDHEDPCPNDPFDDRDRDGICDSMDPCPDGPVDADGDGVCDAQDKCPADAHDDSDGDGKCDSDDACPADAHDDSDGDGGCDSADKCPGHDDRLDTDHDGTPDACDVCPAGSDADEDHNGYADACEQELAADIINLSAPITIPGTFDAAQPGMAAFEPWIDADCLLDGVGAGFVGLPVPQADVTHPVTVIHPRSSSGRAGKLAECLEAGVQLASRGGLAAPDDNYTGDDGLQIGVTSRRMFPLLTGKHVTYFKVVATSFWTAFGSSGGTQVGDFQARISVHGY